MKYAIRICDTIITTLPESTAKPEACFLAGKCYFELDEYDNAIEYYQRIIDDYPAHRFVWQAQHMLEEIAKIQNFISGQ